MIAMINQAYGNILAFPAYFTHRARQAFRFALGMTLGLLLMLSIAGCVKNGATNHFSTAACPHLYPYDAATQAEVYQELNDPIYPTPAANRMMADYGRVREQIRVCLGTEKP